MLLAAGEGSGEDPAVPAGAMGGQAADGGEAAPVASEVGQDHQFILTAS